jgi:hypothetical protein
VCVCVCMYVCMYVYIYIYIHTYTYTYTYTHTQRIADMVYDIGTDSQFLPTALIVLHILFHYFHYVNSIWSRYMLGI